MVRVVPARPPAPLFTFRLQPVGDGLMGLCRVYGQMQFVFGCVQMLLGLCTVPLHIVVVGGASPVHFVDRFQNALVNFLEVVPIVNLSCNHGPSYKRQIKSGYCKSFPHCFSCEQIDKPTIGYKATTAHLKKYKPQNGKDVPPWLLSSQRLARSIWCCVDKQL